VDVSAESIIEFNQIVGTACADRILFTIFMERVRFRVEAVPFREERRKHI